MGDIAGARESVFATENGMMTRQLFEVLLVTTEFLIRMLGLGAVVRLE